MKKFFLVILISLFCLAPMYEIKAQDPLKPKQRTWLRKHGTIQVGVSRHYPPVVFIDELGGAQGIGVDFWRLLSSKLNFWVQFHPAPFKDQMNGVIKGKYDSMAGIFPSKERRQFFDFTKPYKVIQTYIYVKPQYFNLRKLSDIRGLGVSAVSGDSGEIIARKAGLNPLLVATYREALFNLAKGDTDAIIIDELVAIYLAKKYNLSHKIVRIGKPVHVGKLTLPVRKGNTILLGILNKGISMVNNYEWEAIEKRWLGKGIRIFH